MLSINSHTGDTPDVRRTRRLKRTHQRSRIPPLNFRPLQLASSTRKKTNGASTKLNATLTYNTGF